MSAEQDEPANDTTVNNNDDSDSDSSDDDELCLEGVLERVRDDDVSSESDEEEEEEVPMKGPAKSKPKKSKKSSKNSDSDSEDDTNGEILQVEFTFHDMAEDFYHGIHTLLKSTHPPHSQALVNAILENVSVGTVISTKGDEEHNVFGFASVLNVQTHKEVDCVKSLIDICLTNVPEEHKRELSVVLSGKTKRPAGFLIHGRMFNLPLEIVEVYHQQLVLDMEWAVEHAEGGEEERKSLDFGVFLRLAPCVRTSGNGGVVYNYFDDEAMADHAEFVYALPGKLMKGIEDQDPPCCNVIVLTRTGHAEAMKDIHKLIHGAAK